MKCMSFRQFFSATLLGVALIGVTGCSMIAPTTSPPKTAMVQPIGKPIPTNVPGQSSPTPAPTATPVISASKPITALKSVNWKQVLSSDPQLIFDKKATDDAQKVSKVDQGPFVRAKATFGGVEVAGFASLLKDSVMYADISDDGQAEAVIMLAGSGNVGPVGALVYSPDATNKPVLVAVLDGAKLKVEAEEGELVVTRPIVAGFEPACCPSGFNTRRYKLVAGSAEPALKELASENVGTPETQTLVVEQFYKLLNAKKLAEAYEMFGPELRAKQSFDDWQIENGNWKDLRISTKLLPSNVVFVEANGKNGSTAQKMNGVWLLHWNDKVARWQLTDNKVKVVAGANKDVQAPKVANQKITPSVVYYGTSCGTKPTKIVVDIQFSDSSGLAEVLAEHLFLKEKVGIGVAEAQVLQPTGKDTYRYSVDVGTEGLALLKNGTGGLKIVLLATDTAGNQGVIELPQVQVQQCK